MTTAETLSPVQARLYRHVIALLRRGVKVAMVRVEWDPAKAKKRIAAGSEPAAGWHTRPPMTDHAVLERIGRGANCYLYRLPDGAWVIDADTAAARGRFTQLLGNPDVSTGSGGAHWIVDTQMQPEPGVDTEPRQLYGPGSHYLRGDGSMALYTGTVPDLRALRALPAHLPRKTKAIKSAQPTGTPPVAGFFTGSLSAEQARTKAQAMLRAIETGPDGGAEARAGIRDAALFLGGLVHTGLFSAEDAFDRVARACAVRWGAADDDDAKWIEQGLDDGATKPLVVRESTPARPPGKGDVPGSAGGSRGPGRAAWPVFGDPPEYWEGGPAAHALELERMWSFDDLPTVRFWADTWWRWSGGYWHRIDGKHGRGVGNELRRMLLGAKTLKTTANGVEEQPVKLSADTVHETVTFYEAFVGETSSALADGGWFEPDRAPDGLAAATLISTPAGLFDPATRTTHEHTPNCTATWGLPFAYREDAPVPAQWLAFLESTGMDPADVLTLQEWFGYLVSGRTDQQKGLMLLGQRRSGKGTLLNIATALIGSPSVAPMTPAALMSPFGLAGAIGKTLLTIGDARFGGRDTHDVVERLLSIIGEDRLPVDRKFQPTWEGKLRTRVMIASNEVPNVRDASGAFASRFLVLRIPVSHYGREDPQLTPKLLAELPGILLWALAGLDRLRAQGRFTESERAKAEQADMASQQSPVSQFLEELCSPDPTQRVERVALYTLWSLWSKAHGHKPGTSAIFGKNLRAQWPLVRDERPRASGGGGRTWFYCGVAVDQQALDTLLASGNYAGLPDAMLTALKNAPPAL
jgi:putative DNA primase/helicase